MKKLAVLLAVLVLGVGLSLAQDDEEVSTPEDQMQLVGMGTVALSEQGFLMDSEGRTLYLFTNDTENTSNCTGDCLVNWPPLLVDGDLIPGHGVDPELLGTIELEDGTQQVTYNGWPLYYFIGDTEAGATMGQGVGDVWYMLDATGTAIEATEGE